MPRNTLGAPAIAGASTIPRRNTMSERQDSRVYQMKAGDLSRQHLSQYVTFDGGTKTYDGILRHFTHSAHGVHVFITSSDNAVIICSTEIQPGNEITMKEFTR